MRASSRDFTTAALLAVFGILAAACGSSTPEGDIAVLGTVEVPTSAAPPSTAVAQPATTQGDLGEQLANIVDAIDDSSFPETDPDAATGIYGFSRYVWTETANGNVARLLVEGPRGAQTRCQDPDLPCSYLELRAVADGDAELPDRLEMGEGEIVLLADQLDALNQRLSEMTSIDQACAEGFAPETQQNPNMGIHMTNPSLLGGEFDPARPQMLLFAKPDGELISRPDLGDCEDGAWTGDNDYEVVGAAYLQPIQPEHPEGFAGPIDNWHIHYSSCSGATSDAIQGEEQACLEAGGLWFERTPVWMMHAYAADGFDNQQGVFAMYNDSIWPLAQDLTLDGSRQTADAEAQIVGFDYGQITIDAGESVTFSNSDGVPHTVTAGRPGAPTGGFDSGLLGAGATFTAEFDQPGDYAIFCTLHPQMTATVRVE